MSNRFHDMMAIWLMNFVAWAFGIAESLTLERVSLWLAIIYTSLKIVDLIVRKIGERKTRRGK